MKIEREIRVTLLDGSEVLMNTGDRVLFQASRSGAIPLAVDANTIIDDVLAALEEADKTVAIADRNAREAINGYMEKELAALQLSGTLAEELAMAQQILEVKEDTIKFLDSKLAEAQQAITRKSELLNEAKLILIEARETIFLQRKALEWYADEENYWMVTRWRGDPASPVDCDMIEDGGARARGVLEGGLSDIKAPKYILWREWNADSPPEPENMYLVTDGHSCEKAWLIKDDDGLTWYLPDLRSINRREDITHYGVIELPGGNKEGEKTDA